MLCIKIFTTPAMSRIFNSRVNKLMLTQKNISNPATQEDTNKYRITILSCDTSWSKPARNRPSFTSSTRPVCSARVSSSSGTNLALSHKYTKLTLCQMPGFKLLTNFKIDKQIHKSCARRRLASLEWAKSREIQYSEGVIMMLRWGISSSQSNSLS